MKTKTLLGISCALIITNLHAQQNPTAAGASTAPANASAAYTKSWTAFQNPAILAYQEHASFSLHYDNRFELKELSTEMLSLNLPTKAMHLGVGLSHFGYSEYHEIQGGLSVARAFSKKFSLGLGFNYYAVSVSQQDGNRGALIVQIGLLSEISEGFYIGFHAFNPAQTNIQFETVEKQIPSVFSLGSSYVFSEKLIWVAQIDKEIEQAIIWRTGFEYQLTPSFSLCLGGYGNPFVPSMGIGFLLKKLACKVNFERHPLLGINSTCSLNYTFR